MHIEKCGFTPSSEYFLDAGKEVGKRVIDPNAFQTEGLQTNKNLMLIESSNSLLISLFPMLRCLQDSFLLMCFKRKVLGLAHSEDI
jgi:hypothetical protein